eukprot:11255794-Alexandrium_andersonii.AAC.1
MEALRPRASGLQQGPGALPLREPPTGGRPPGQPPCIRDLVECPPSAPIQGRSNHRLPVAVGQ